MARIQAPISNHN
uniref:Uncharacterized protein n=1 Tax=Arundo donax TaxID=35708 RepID=A0A0A9CB31_ARUDO